MTLEKLETTLETTGGKRLNKRHILSSHSNRTLTAFLLAPVIGAGNTNKNKGNNDYLHNACEEFQRLRIH